ncbi:ChaN family lipoprotein [Cupriavidus sp. DB3]|uniref:ChaN family lipoprotein n=1 Tax=Cupriavidus sp. DB3 TaxID=2873259 RepID=UPI001CF1C1D3|nr:ChaN family lipoprotein [Cupriavidus sp. DB3]MCA7084818.1 ChaN family lipoprotein [Cupriavidus sp. DB3]
MAKVAAMAAALALLAGCATAPAHPEGDAHGYAHDGAHVGAHDGTHRLAAFRYVLLGEVHDNPEGHRRRLASLTEAIDAGWRPAIAMEQFDRERQADLDRARRERPGDADHLIARAGAAGWDWSLYRPVIALALRHDLPLIAANLSRDDARGVMRGGDVFGAAERERLGLARPLPADLAAAQTAVLDGSHCGHFPRAMLPGMLNAQAARDAVMAAALRAHAAHGVVLLAGNGHVREDIGVPRWLGAKPAEVLTVAYLERAAPDEAGAYDHVVLVPPVQRADPCGNARPAPR